VAGERGGRRTEFSEIELEARASRVVGRRGGVRGIRIAPRVARGGSSRRGWRTIYARHRQKRQCQNSDHTTREAADSVARRARARTFAFFARDWTGDERTLPRVSPAQASLRDVNVHMVAISRTAPLRDLSALDEHTAAFDL
jgi:hypothetical protein